VQALDRSRQVIALIGDGGFNMLMGEFMTAVNHRLPVKVIIYNNSALGLITLEAESVGLVPIREAIEFSESRFAALARACGGHGFMARKQNELMAAIAEALAVDGPAIVDVVCDRRRDAEHAACRLAQRSGIMPWPRSRKPCSPSLAGDELMSELINEALERFDLEAKNLAAPWTTRSATRCHPMP